jgi:hypothetical protein
LAISIPIVLSGVDADGNNFADSVRTLIVNQHGGKIATARHLAVGKEVLIENRALGVAAKASVVWMGDKHYTGDLHHVGLQLIEAQNIWGLAFPPNDWRSQLSEEALPAAETALPAPQAALPPPEEPPALEHAESLEAEPRVPSLAGEEITIRLLQELQESADAHAREFEERVKQLTHRLGLELEMELRERAARAQEHEVGALQEEIKVLKVSLSAAREEIGKLETKTQELKRGLEAATGTAPPTPLQEARRQLTAMTNSVIESMNHAARAGLNEYRSLLQKENQASAGRRRTGGEEIPPPPGTGNLP